MLALTIIGIIVVYLLSVFVVHAFSLAFLYRGDKNILWDAEQVGWFLLCLIYPLWVPFLLFFFGGRRLTLYLYDKACWVYNEINNPKENV